MDFIKITNTCTSTNTIKKKRVKKNAKPRLRKIFSTHILWGFLSRIHKEVLHQLQGKGHKLEYYFNIIFTKEAIRIANEHSKNAKR